MVTALASSAAGNVTVAGVEYPLYTHVHHGYGLNDAFDRSVTLLTRHLPRGRGLLDEVMCALAYHAQGALAGLLCLHCCTAFRDWVSMRRLSP